MKSIFLKRITIFVLVLLCLFSLTACKGNKNNKHIEQIPSTVKTDNIPTETNMSGNPILNTNPSKKIKKLLGFEFVLPNYLSEKRVFNDKYDGTVYDLGQGAYVGISKYSHDEKYPSGTIVYSYSDDTSMISILEYTCCDTMGQFFNLEDFSVNESKYEEESQIEVGNKAYRYTGFIYTDEFSETPDSDDPAKRKFVYFYSNIVRVNDEFACIWVMDTSEYHIHQMQAASILNDVLMSKI